MVRAKFMPKQTTDVHTFSRNFKVAQSCKWGPACVSFSPGMDNPTKHDPFQDHTFVESGNESPPSDSGSESSSSSSSSTGSPDSLLSPVSSDSEASGAPQRDATKKLFQQLYNSCKDSDLQSIEAILPGAFFQTIIYFANLSIRHWHKPLNRLPYINRH